MKLDTTPMPGIGDLEAFSQVRHDTTMGLKEVETTACEVFDALSADIHRWFAAQGFWDSGNTGEKLMLMVSELSEAMEADRKDLMSDKIPEFTGVEEELADVMVRIFDFAGRHNLRLGEAFFAKMEMNMSRPFKHGKKY